MLTRSNQPSELGLSGLDVSSFLGLTPRVMGVDGSAVLAELKERLVGQHTASPSEALEEEAIRRALDEADSIALLTPHPHLFLPVLAEEKVHAARRWLERQREILDRTIVAFAE